jgi:hypothetical protein
MTSNMMKIYQSFEICYIQNCISDVYANLSLQWFMGVSVVPVKLSYPQQST